MTQAKNTICLWYDGEAEEAARFYAKTFPDSSVDAVHKLADIYCFTTFCSCSIIASGLSSGKKCPPFSTVIT
jgi:hypothetical protein